MGRWTRSTAAPESLSRFVYMLGFLSWLLIKVLVCPSLVPRLGLYAILAPWPLRGEVGGRLLVLAYKPQISQMRP